MAEIDVEFVEGDVCGGEEDLLDERVDTLEDSQIEELGTGLIQIRHQFAAPVSLRHH